MHLHIRQVPPSQGPWNAISCDWAGGPTLRSVLFVIPDRGHHVLTIRGNVFAVSRDPYPDAKIPGGRWQCKELEDSSVRHFLELFGRQAADIDTLFGDGTAQAAAILAGDPRLRLDTLVGVLGARSNAARRNRAQALRQFPLLTAFLMMQKSPRMKILFLPDQIAAVIDRGDPLIPALVNVFETSPWVIRHLRGCTLHDVNPYESISKLVSDISQLIPERAPARHSYPLLAFLSGNTHQWHPWVQAVARQAVIKNGWPDLGTRIGRIANIEDYALFVEGLLAKLPPLRLGTRLQTLDSVLGSPTLAQLQRLSDRWHGIERRLQPPMTTSQESTGDSWRPLFPGVAHQAGFALRCLTSAAALALEGAEMQHCVGGYVHRCSRGESHIIAITCGDERVATAQVRLTLQSGRIVPSVSQIAGARNASCPKTVSDALDTVLSGLDQESLKDFPIPMPYQSEARDEYVIRRFEITLRDLGRGALDLYRPCLQISKTKSLLWDALVQHHARNVA